MVIKRTNTEYLPPRITWSDAQEMSYLYDAGAYECAEWNPSMPEYRRDAARTAPAHWIVGQVTWIVNYIRFLKNPKKTFQRLYAGE